MAARCPLCDYPAAFWFKAGDYHYGNRGTWDLFRCQSCSHCFQFPFPDQDALSEYYPDDYYTHTAPTIDFTPKGMHLRRHWLRMHYLKHDRGYSHLHLRRSYVLAILGRAFYRVPLDFDSPSFVPDGRLLDFGCGSGEYVSFARFVGWNAEGMDLDGAAIRAGLDAGLPLMLGSIDLLSKLQHRYDYIRCSHSVEHVLDARSLFKSFWEALKPGGVLAVDVPNADSASTKHFKELSYYLGLPVHIHLFTPRSLTHIASAAGFRDIVLSTYSVWYTQAASSQLKHFFSAGKPTTNGFPFEISFDFVNRLRSLPCYLRSLSGFSGDCLVMKAKKPGRASEAQAYGAG